jgi:glutathione-specific gamma-glutamylcyclotransferase
VAWIFAYGSLMGDAVLRRYSARPARLPEARRAFLHESRRRWGTPEAPCPILGLAPGGECWGLAFEVPDADRGALLRTLEKREAAAERRRETRTAETPEGAVDACVWVSRTPNGHGATDLETLEARLRAAHGVVGTGAEYVRTVVHAMEPHGIGDPLVDALWARLRG